ncbi:MAG: hypothetical protein ACOC9Z_05585, partial [Chloroflexota bacterium]
TLDANLPEAHEKLRQLETLDIDLDQITAELQENGVESFADSFNSLLTAIAEKCERLRAAPEPVTSASGTAA